MDHRRSWVLVSLLAIAAPGGCGSTDAGSGGTGAASTSDGAGGRAPQGECGACIDSDEPQWCFATQRCAARGGADCPYGLVEGASNCTDPQVPEPTDLAIDCRHPRSEDEPKCQPFSNQDPAIGLGLDLERYQLGDGFVDAANNRLVLTFNCLTCPGSDTGIIAVDLDTGDRTLLSGHYDDTLDGAVTRGAGEQPSSLDAVKVLPNGKWIALDNVANGAEIYEIDPVSGDRTVIYQQGALAGDVAADGAGPGICKVGDGVALGVGHNYATTEATGAATTLLVGADGTLYLRAVREATPVDDDLDISAIVALKDGACSIVTLWSGGNPELNVGAGPDIFRHYSWLVDDGGRILAQRGSYLLHAIDKATGNRSVVASAVEGSARGAGPELGDAYAVLSSDGTTLHTIGAEIGAGMVDVTLATGDRAPYGFLARSSREASRTLGPVFAYPKIQGVYLIAPEGGLILYEPRSGNYVNFAH